MRPVPATVADTLPAQAQGSTARASTATGGACQSAANPPRFPHRRVFVDSSWRAARAWIGVAYPTVKLEAALSDLQARFPALAANIARLEAAAQSEATTYQNEPTTAARSFQAAIHEWETAVLDGLAALAFSKRETHG